MSTVTSSILENFNEAVNFIYEIIKENPGFLAENSEIRKKMYEVYKISNFNDIAYQDEFDNSVENYEKKPSCSIADMQKNNLGELAEKLITTFPEVKLFIHEKDITKSVIIALFTSKQIAVNSLVANSCAIPIEKGYYKFNINDINKEPITTIVEVFGNSVSSYNAVAKKKPSKPVASSVAHVKKQPIILKHLEFDECPDILNHETMKKNFSNYESLLDSMNKYYTRFNKDERLTYIINNDREYTIGPITDKYICKQKFCFSIMCLKLHVQKCSTNKNACDSCNLYSMEFKKGYNTRNGYSDDVEDCDINYFRFVNYIFKCTKGCKKNGCLGFEIKKIDY